MNIINIHKCTILAMSAELIIKEKKIVIPTVLFVRVHVGISLERAWESYAAFHCIDSFLPAAAQSRKYKLIRV